MKIEIENETNLLINASFREWLWSRFRIRPVWEWIAGWNLVFGVLIFGVVFSITEDPLFALLLLGLPIGILLFLHGFWREFIRRREEVGR